MSSPYDLRGARSRELNAGRDFCQDTVARAKNFAIHEIRTLIARCSFCLSATSSVLHCGTEIRDDLNWLHFAEF